MPPAGPPSHPAPPSHEQLHHHPVPVSNHPNYNAYQQQYMPPRPHLLRLNTRLLIRVRLLTGIRTHHPVPPLALPHLRDLGNKHISISSTTTTAATCAPPATPSTSSSTPHPPHHAHHPAQHPSQHPSQHPPQPAVQHPSQHPPTPHAAPPHPPQHPAQHPPQHPSQHPPHGAPPHHHQPPPPTPTQTHSHMHPSQAHHQPHQGHQQLRRRRITNFIPIHPTNPHIHHSTRPATSAPTAACTPSPIAAPAATTAIAAPASTASITITLCPNNCACSNACRTRPYPASEPERVPSARDSTMSENYLQIIKHCTDLYSFASRYAQLQNSVPHARPSPEELADMAQRANQVIRLLEEYRRLNLPENERSKIDRMASDDHRPPKRPWEDMSQEGGVQEGAPLPEQYSTTGDKAQSTAEQDMEIIRTKRATSAAGGSGTAGQPKSKYRKRSSGQRATPPGKCHSCNIRETPEWRRGPDGARTLCNACGLHYAKLMRKRVKAQGSGGEPPRIDMDTLRASARAADLADKSHPRSSKQQASQSEPASPMESEHQQQQQQPQQQHHQGSFQLSMMTPDHNSSSTPSESGRVALQTMQQPSSGGMALPQPSWGGGPPSSASGGRGYPPEQLQHQSFMRTSNTRRHLRRPLGNLRQPNRLSSIEFACVSPLFVPEYTSCAPHHISWPIPLCLLQFPRNRSRR
ncbi:hypothetical protein BD779DRAFT_562732 [Infundibulicybe gibba]|nr:hypothetical protein BD779DRAFT_562732 [Infundibulicybe gibba]